ncbi:MAG: DUF1919 domain-containing protein [Selenomonadaceae bacterium]|nr:DUF1919 domain-containing protein [Selenomonadaceae bacterium]
MAINGKPRVVIWFVSNDGRFIGNAVNILERQFNGIETVGVTAGQKISVTDATGKVLPFIPLNEISLNGGGYDVLLVSGAKNFGMSEVVKFAKLINLDTEKLLGDWIVCIPGFTLDKYRQLQRSKLSIFSAHCFGGIMSNTLGLPFRSPFVNLFMHQQEFIKFLQHPHVYIEDTPIFDRIETSNTTAEAPNGYPVFSLGNVSVHMQHYPEVGNALKKWESRKQRINWYNLIAVMSTEDPKILEQFDRLPYGKKICFVSFKSDLDSAFYVSPKHRRGRENFNECAFDIARGILFYYDPFDMLLYGKKTQLIDM